MKNTANELKKRAEYFENLARDKYIVAERAAKKSEKEYHMNEYKRLIKIAIESREAARMYETRLYDMDSEDFENTYGGQFEGRDEFLKLIALCLRKYCSDFLRPENNDCGDDTRLCELCRKASKDAIKKIMDSRG